METANNYQLEKLPPSLRQTVAQKITAYEEKLALQGLRAPTQIDFVHSLPKVWCCSAFVADSCIHSPALIADLVLTGDLLSTQRRQNYAPDLNALTVDSEPTLMRVLRYFRRREMVRIAWRDLAGWSPLSDTLAELTQLAEVCIQFALAYLYTQACASKGTPISQAGIPLNIVVLGMGKLGGKELNYSSDIDLIFAYAEDGVLVNKKATTYGEFFSQLCRKLVKALDEITVDGFVFRTDTRLRPFGASGPIIMTFAGLENYYVAHAREWERYAMIKARQVAGDSLHGDQLLAMIKPFVYRRYLDYGAVTELRSLKRQISLELQRQDRADNIKLGTGGIREIEFIGQAFQLIRGGKETALQSRSILKTLAVLSDQQLLAADEATELQASYCFLRQLENHLQQYQDKQTHDLPKDAALRQILAYAMGCADWASLKLKLDCVRQQVQGVFDHVFCIGDEPSSEHHSIAIWEGSSSEVAIAYLQQQGIKQPQAALTLLQDFKQAAAIKRLSSKGAEVINRLLPQLIAALSTVANSDQTLKRVLGLFEAVAGRNVYLSLLAENSQALSQLLNLVAKSPWICEQLANHPMLFDELLDTRSLYEPLTRQQLQQQLASYLSLVDGADVEQFMIKLREFKQVNVLRVAATDIMGATPLLVVSDYLSIIAEVISEQALQKCWKILTDKHGYPPNSSDRQLNFAIIAAGKLGGEELSYSSDLDLIFISNNSNDNALTGGDKPISCAQFYGLLSQKFGHIMQTKMLSGLLYQVDLRLRPNGASGLVVTPIKSYADYLQHNAWTWEHQALVRGRFIAGDSALQQQYTTIRQAILCQPRNKNTLQQEVCAMRAKMHATFTTKGATRFDLKHCIGGMVDIEFIVQFLVLAHAAENNSLSVNTSNIKLLDTLQQTGYLSSNDVAALKQAYCQYRDYEHQQALQGNRARISGTDLVATRAQVERIWQQQLNNSNE